MAITSKKPPLKQTVGAQYYDFATVDADDKTVFTGEYEGNIVKTETVKTSTISENTSQSDVYASGIVYTSVIEKPKVTIEVEEIAVVRSDLYQMRGDIVSENGAISHPAYPFTPYFAYGRVVKYRDGTKVFEWYPKCQLGENTDEASTSEESFSEQTETITINAYPIVVDDESIHCIKCDTSVMTSITEDAFFAQVLTSNDELDALVAA